MYMILHLELGSRHQSSCVLWMIWFFDLYIDCASVVFLLNLRHDKYFDVLRDMYLNYSYLSFASLVSLVRRDVAELLLTLLLPLLTGEKLEWSHLLRKPAHKVL